jgi:hypothetical protein
MVRGSPSPYPLGHRVFQFGILLAAGEHESFKIDFDLVRERVPGYATGVDVIEITSDVYGLNERKGRWEHVSAWEFCMDDIKLEIVDGPDSTVVDSNELDEIQWYSRAEDGSLIATQGLGEQIGKNQDSIHQ